MHAVGAARQRDVEPIVDDEPGGRAAGDGQHGLDEGRQRAGLQIALADLNQIDAASTACSEPGQQEATGVSRRAGAGEPPPIGDQADHARVLSRSESSLVSAVGELQACGRRTCGRRRTGGEIGKARETG